MAAKGGMALVTDSERRTRRVRTFQIDLDKPEQEARSSSGAATTRTAITTPALPWTKAMPNGDRRPSCRMATTSS